MKSLVLIRHAESEWAISGGDINRKLTKKGCRDAKQIATSLSLQKIFPQRIYSSVATRALETAAIFMEVFNIGKENLTIEKSLYEPSVESFYKVAGLIPEEVHIAFIFSHNNGISEFINNLDCHSPIQMPACGVFAVEVDTNNWNFFRTAKKRFCFLTSPACL